MAGHNVPKKEPESFGGNSVTNVKFQKRSESSMNNFISIINSTTVEFHISVLSDDQLISTNVTGDS